MRERTPIAERFWRRVDKSGDCWEWQGARKENGYGVIGLDRHRRSRYTHRLSWELEHGPIPSGQQVLHRCDNRPCVRPEHLFLGSQQDNQTDMAMKGRSLRGERHNFARLTEGDVVEIRRAWAAGGVLQTQLAARFGVSKGQISEIVRGTSWRHLLPDDWTPPAPNRWCRP